MKQVLDVDAGGDGILDLLLGDHGHELLRDGEDGQVGLVLVGGAVGLEQGTVCILDEPLVVEVVLLELKSHLLLSDAIREGPEVHAVEDQVLILILVIVKAVLLVGAPASKGHLFASEIIDDHNLAHDPLELVEVGSR